MVSMNKLYVVHDSQRRNQDFFYAMPKAAWLQNGVGIKKEISGDEDMY